jgi:alpha-galactosidase
MNRKSLRLLIAVPVILSMVLFAFLTRIPQAYAVNNGLALTPPMGWNDWNRYGCSISDSLIRQQASAMVSSGMKAAGYQYINIDDCWPSKSRDSNGNIVPDPSKFPNGMKSLADYVHSLGLKLGLYTDAGTATCAGYPGMYGHEQQDANTYASWGIDYLKVDWCSSTGEDAQTEYTKIGNALRSSGRSIVFSLCEWGQSNVWTWGPGVGNLWRTTGDISDNWSSMLSNFDSSSSHASSAGPGGWNDPDMLEVGNGGMSTTQDQAHFSLWAISAAPLITGTDLTSMSSTTKSILTNTDVIAVDQDPLGIQGTKVADNGNGLQVWAKKLQGGSVAVVLLNRNGSSSNITVNWSNIGISGSASVRDLWSHTNVGSFNGSYTANVAGTGVVMLKISAGSGGGTTPTPTPTSGGGSFNPSVYYRLISHNSGEALDVVGQSKANGALVDQWPYTGNANQQWSIIAVGGYYKLISRNSGEALDVAGQSTANGASVDQWPDSGTANQQWSIISIGSGYYKLINHNSGQALDVAGQSKANGALVDQWPDSGSANQQWSIIQVS